MGILYKQILLLKKRMKGKKLVRKIIFRITIIGLLFLFVLGLNSMNLLGTSIVVPPDIEIYVPKPINILLLVSDQVSSNTDSIMVVNYKPVSAQISILSIPRDTKVKIDNEYRKINSAFWRGKGDGNTKAGIAQVVDCINQLFKIDIKYYAVLNLKCVRMVVNELGGVDYNIPFDMKYTARSQHLYIDLKKGFQHLDGSKVLQLMRFRHPNGTLTREVLNNMKGYDGGDATRVDNNQKFIKEFFKQKAKPEILLDIKRINRVLQIIVKNTETNLKFTDLIKYSKSAAGLASGKMNAFRLLGVDERPEWYYVFNNTFMNNSNRTHVDAKKIITKYFGLNEIKKAG